MSFSKLGLEQPLIDAIHELGYQKPTHIQTQAIPSALNGQDLLAAAQTGTGKTASFVLPILQKLNAGQTQKRNVLARSFLRRQENLLFKLKKNPKLWEVFITKVNHSLWWC